MDISKARDEFRKSVTALLKECEALGSGNVDQEKVRLLGVAGRESIDLEDLLLLVECPGTRPQFEVEFDGMLRAADCTPGEESRSLKERLRSSPLYALAVDAIKAGALLFRQSGETYCGSPYDGLLWARKEGCPFVVPELHQMVVDICEACKTEADSALTTAADGMGKPKRAGKRGPQGDKEEWSLGNRILEARKYGLSFTEIVNTVYEDYSSESGGRDEGDIHTERECHDLSFAITMNLRRRRNTGPRKSFDEATLIREAKRLHSGARMRRARKIAVQNDPRPPEPQRVNKKTRQAF